MNESFRRIGKGRFGVCYAMIKNSYPVALKVLSKQKLKQKGLAQAYNEIELHHPLCHPNICKMLSWMESSISVCIILELCDGSLRDYLNINAPLPIGVCKQMTYHIAQGLMYIHGMGIIHRDIKPHNILLKPLDLDYDVYVPKITDFGWAIRNSHAVGKAGTLAYMAPEMLQNNRTYGCSVDVWALGCVIHAMLDHGQSPFKDVTPETTLSHIQQINQVRTSPKDIENIISLILVKPKDRVELSAIIEWSQTPVGNAQDQNI